MNPSPISKGYEFVDKMKWLNKTFIINTIVWLVGNCEYIANLSSCLNFKLHNAERLPLFAPMLVKVAGQYIGPGAWLGLD
jgi:hypothetical protein